MTMELRRFSGVEIESGGLIVKGADYRGKFQLEVQSADGETHYFVLDREQVDRLNALTAEPVGSCATEPSLRERLIALLPWRE